MYFVVVDMLNSKAYQCPVISAGDPWNFTQVLFITETEFLGQRNISPSQIELCEYEIIMSEEGAQLVRNDHNFCMKGVGITAFSYDSKYNSLFLMQQ